MIGSIMGAMRLWATRTFRWVAIHHQNLEGTLAMKGAAESGKRLYMALPRMQDMATEPHHVKLPDARSTRRRAQLRAAFTSFRGQLALALALAVIVRVFILVMAHGMMDGDEAVLGIQAERILHGARPIYFYGQLYMGSWDAYLVAPIIAVFGPSSWVLHAVTLTESLLLVPLMGALAERLYGVRARFPAMLLAALPPLYDVITQLRMLGGYVETLDLGIALMLLMTLIAQRWERGRPTFWLWALAGFVAGLGFWIDLLIAYYLIACALWITPVALAHYMRSRKRGGASTQHHGIGDILLTLAPANSAKVTWRAGAALSNGAICVLAALVGAAPAMYFALSNHLKNVLTLNGFPLVPSANPLRRATLYYLFVRAVPTIVGARLAYPVASPAAHLAKAFCVVAGTLALGALIYTLARLAAPHARARWVPAWRQRLRTLSAHMDQRWRDSFPLILIVVILLVFWRSGATNLPLSRATDEQRYALPLLTALVLLYARAFGDFGKPGLFAAPHDRQAAEAEQSLVETRRTPRSSFGAITSSTRARWLAAVGGVGSSSRPIWLGAVLVLTLVSFATPYAFTNMAAAMESPYNPGGVFPVQDASMLSYLESHHIHAAWANHWTGNVIMYLSDQEVLCADYVDQVLLHGQRRFPDVFAQVEGAEKPSFIITSKPSDGEPLVARALDSLGVRYDSARFGNYVVITPLSRTVHPQEIVWALSHDYYNNA